MVQESRYSMYTTSYLLVRWVPLVRHARHWLVTYPLTSRQRTVCFSPAVNFVQPNSCATSVGIYRRVSRCNKQAPCHANHPRSNAVCLQTKHQSISRSDSDASRFSLGIEHAKTGPHCRPSRSWHPRHRGPARHKEQRDLRHASVPTPSSH